jgi:hypothetical protein
MKVKTALASVILLYYCIPKFNLITISGMPTGIRLQDIFAALGFMLVVNGRVFASFLEWKVVSVFIIFMLANISSAYFITGNLLLPLLGWLRIFEYFVIACVVVELLMNYRGFIVLSFIIYMNLFVAMLQLFFILPNVDPGRGVHYSNEFSGFYGTPAELSYGLVVIAFLIIIVEKRNSIKYLLPVLLLNGVKAAVLSLLVLFVSKVNIRVSLIAFIISSAVIIFMYGDSLKEFVITIFRMDFTGYELADLKSYRDESLSEISLGHRVGKWGVALHLLNKEAAGWLFGYGMYAAGGALDGGLLRLFFECGLLGYIVVYLSIRKTGVNFILLIVSVNLLFDGYISSVVMPILIAIAIMMRKVSKYR